MNQENPKNWRNGVEHPAEDELLFFIDGELPAKDSVDIKAHLEACWDCRNRAEKFQSAISLYVDYRANVLKPLIEPPGSWSGFDSKLRQQAAELAPPTVWQRFQGMIQRFRISLPRFEQRSLRLTTISIATVLLGAIGIYVLLIGVNTIVSAEELIGLAVASREAELKKTDQPVLYQHLHVTRRNADREEAANVEVWQDVENLRIRKVVTTLSEGDPGTVLTDLEQILKASKYDPPPLSIVGFRGWRNTLDSKKDSVEQLITDGGVSALRLETVATGKIDPNRLIASVLTVRSSDYHPLEQIFRVLTSDGVQEYEVRESSFAVMSLNSLNPGFFADSQPMVVSARPEPKPSASTIEVANTNTTNTNTVMSVTAPNTIASAELEVEVANALHSVGADLGEQIEVRRTPNGPVTIVGVVETPERKAQILNGLGTLKDNPAVRVQINTVSEALAAEKTNKARAQPSVERVEVDTDSYPAEGDLLAHFKDAPTARNFAARMTGQSSRAMNYLWAMRRLKGQFSASQIEKLTPQARAKLLGVVRSYAASYQREAGTLRQELQPVFGGGPGSGGSSRIGSDAEMIQLMDQLFSAGSGVNQVVRTAFTTGSTATNALGAPQFWQTLSRAESLAASIERYR